MVKRHARRLESRITCSKSPFAVAGSVWAQRLSVLRLRRKAGHELGGSHSAVVGTAAALGRNPGDVLRRILDFACFAVNAIGRVYDKARRRVVDDFEHAGRKKVLDSFVNVD